MPITTLSARQFNQMVGQAKKCALSGPVFVMDRGKQTHVLLNIEEYRRITGKELTLTQMLWDPAVAQLDDLEIPRRETQEFKYVDFD